MQRMISAKDLKSAVGKLGEATSDAAKDVMT